MENSSFIEEEFVKFYHSTDMTKLSSTEYSACQSFYDLCISDSQFTEKQASYLKYILKKYSQSADISLSFKKLFRILDNVKSISVSREDFKVFINFKFPYAFLKTFEEEIDNTADNKNMKLSTWDPENKLRKVNLFNTDLLKISEFANRHDFRKDRSFLELESLLQETINDQENIVPHSYQIDGRIDVVNADKESREYFESKRKNNVSNDLLLAKTLGYPLKFFGKNKSLFETISASKDNFFWCPRLDDYFDIVNTVDSKTCIIIDRNDQERSWLKRFIEESKLKIPKKKIMICFRESQEENGVFNKWIKENDLGGSVETGDIYIFQHKPPKWLFKQSFQMMFVATTIVNPPTNTITQDFLSSHPCVIHLGDITPTAWRNKKIVDL